MRLHVDVVSDVICPWCFIGKRRLEKALRALGPQAEVRVEWHPFELNSEMPREGMDRKAYRAAKFGDATASAALDARLAAVGAGEGIPFAFDRIRRTPNTLDAHRLIWLARRESVQEGVVEGLFQSYFVDGADVGDRRTLVNVGVAHGLSRGLVERFLESDEGVAAVRQAESEALGLGIQGVPYFIIDRKYGISGAQSPDTLVSVFEQIMNPKMHPTAAPAERPGRASSGQ